MNHSSEYKRQKKGENWYLVKTSIHLWLHEEKSNR